MPAEFIWNKGLIFRQETFHLAHNFFTIIKNHISNNTADYLTSNY